ncbi:MAG: TonB-dependent receptor plug domain-containing protein, partial [Planctomycetaceae bacterium]
MKRRILLAVFALFLFTSSGISQDTSQDSPEIPETVVIGRPESFPRAPLKDSSLLTPGASAASRKTTGASIEVITAEQLQKQGATTVLDALRNRTGISTSQNGGAGSLTSLFLRGSNSAHTKVLIDGIPMNDPSGASRA